MDSEQPRVVDAVKCHHSFKGTGSAASRLRRLQDHFGPVLGGRVFHRNQGECSYLVHNDNQSHSLLFPADHPRAGEDRYDWEDRGDGVLYGYLKPDDDTDTK